MVWLRRLLWLVGGVLALWALAWLAVPPLLKWQAEQRLSELLGRSVTVGKVDFSPWNLQLAVSDIAIAAAPGAPSQAPLLQVAGLHVDLDARSLLHRAPVIESLRIDAPRLRVARTSAGHYDFDDLLRRLAGNPDAKPGEPPHFALYNLEVHDGELLFDDAPVQRQHRLSGLNLTLPFLSNLPADLEVKVEPRLAFALNGTAFDSGAQAVPFAKSHSGALTLKVGSIDLTPYLGYLPESLPVRVKRGHVAAELALDFAAPEQAEARISVRGGVGAAGLSLTEADGAPLLDIGKLSLALNDVQPLARKVGLGALKIDALELHVARDAQGALSLARLRAAPARAASAAAPASAPQQPAAAPAAWQVSLDSVELIGARVLWNDAAVKPASAFVLDDMSLTAQQVKLPMAAPVPFALKGTLKPQNDATKTLAVLALDGQATDAAVTVGVDLSALSLAALAPYVSAAASAQVAGTGAIRGKVDWAAAAADKPQRLVATIADLTFDGLKANVAGVAKTGKGGDIVAVERLQISGAEVDLAAAKIAIASLKLQQPELQLARAGDGVWNVMGLAGTTPLTQDPRADVRAAASKAWQVELKDFLLDRGHVHLLDEAPAAPRAGGPAQAVRLDIDRLRVAVQGVQLNGASLASRPRVQLSARINPDAGPEPGRTVTPGVVDWRGQIGVAPLYLHGTARIEHFPVHAVQAYAREDHGLQLARAEAGFQGDVSVQQAGAGLSIDTSGDVLLSDLLLLGPPGTAGAGSGSDRELLSWQSLALKGLKVSVRPDALPRVAIADATLSDFFARLILTQEGHLNLRDVAAGPSGAPASAPANVPASTPASAPVAVAAASAPARRLPLELDLGGLKLLGGRVDFSDRFVKPNYSAALTELNGEIGAFRSGSGEPASLRLSGRAAGTGLLEINGKLNPGSVPRELDIAAKASDLELAPLSTYAGKYAGYAIERGKLSVEVHYKIEKDGKLEASHQVILNQLTFGERVESPTATKLPVLLAVWLLKDANGVIDINLPVSGTVSDPKFSVGGLIWQVIVNLLTRAAKAPFTLLAGGGGHDISVVEFQPGTSLLTDGGATTIDKVAKALGDRPALKMTVTGEADANGEREAYRVAAVERRLQQELRREQLRATGKAPEPDAPPPAIPDAERPRLVKEVYQQTDLPDKPRNVIGLKADIAPAEMEALLRQHVDVSPEAIRALALQRGLVVRDTLTTKGLTGDRLFLGAPKIRASAEGDPPWSPQVKLDLSTK